MTNLIIGDFRSKQLQQCQPNSYDIRINYTYLLDDAAEYSWFSTNAVAQLLLMSLDKANVIIMLGFNDCVYSCVWKSFNIDTIATDYVSAINSLVKQYSSLNFYVIPVLPVDANYAFSVHADGFIGMTDLNNKIDQFNKIIKSCKATYIDCYNYLKDTSFNTRDGVRYTSETCDSLISFIFNNLKTDKNTSNFVPRFKKPIVNSNDLERDKYWIHTSAKGLNPFPIPGKYTNSAKDTLPNCTAYAWGRFYEITGTKPKLCKRNAERWYLYTSDGYLRGSTPKEGAVICWQKGKIGDPGAGHVAIVEQINDDGSIITSESGWETSRYWWLAKRTVDSYVLVEKRGDDIVEIGKKYKRPAGNWGQKDGYTFQGFIYCPAVTAAPNVVDVTLEALRLNTVMTTKFEASFIIKNGSKYKYSIFDEANNKIYEATIPITTNNDLQVVSFDYDKLEPNTSYKLIIEAVGVIGGKIKTQTIKFNTPQSHPDSVKKLTLSCNDKIKSINDTFTLEVEMPTNFGYWHKNGSGYEKLLIVNGKCEKIVNIDGILNISNKKFTIKNEFGYECKTGDIVQIGIRIWTIDNNGEKIYDAPAAKTSEPICLLNNSVQAYVMCK